MPKLGLRIKFFLYSNTLIVVTMTVVTVLALVQERRSRYEAIDRRGRSIAEAMVISVSDTLASGGPLDAVATGEYIDRIQALNRDLMRYAVVADAGGS